MPKPAVLVAAEPRELRDRLVAILLGSDLVEQADNRSPDLVCFGCAGPILVKDLGAVLRIGAQRKTRPLAIGMELCPKSR